MLVIIPVALLVAFLIGKNAMDLKETGYDEDYREISYEDGVCAPRLS